MSTERLNDRRDAEALAPEELMRDLFDARLEIMRREAAAEKQISEIREQVRLDTTRHRLILELREAQLSAYILSHADDFRRPRQRKCPWGRYGMRTSTRLQVEDQEAVIQWAKERGYDDVFRVTETLLKPAVTKRLAAGEAVPGCHAVVGEASEYTLDQAALEAEI